MECELLETCGFFRKYADSLDLACRGFIKSYCKGEKMDSCSRKLHRTAHGTPPENDMMPSGQIMPKAYQSS